LFFSALPANGLFDRQASSGRPKACVSFVLPSWTERAALIVAESFGTNGRFAPEAANRRSDA
jgi:hypothetical protein